MKLVHDSRDCIYRMPFGAVTTNEKVTLRLSVIDGKIPEHILAIVIKNGEKEYIPMNYWRTFCDVCIYEAEVDMPSDVGIVWYYFEVKTPMQTMYYGNGASNLGGLGQMYDSEPNFLFQITVYDKNFKTPKWFSNSVVYQIFVDRFYNGNDNGEFLGNRNDIIKRNWEDIPLYKAEQFGGEYLANDFFGGNLSGVIKKLPYLSDLGISAIYLNPIFKAYSNHKYDTGDFKLIDEMFGSNEIFEKLCQEADKFGIKIILDGVFNHTGSDSRYFNKKGTYDSVGAYQSEQSPYYSWFKFINYPDLYESWWGIDTLVEVEESSPQYQDYMLKDDDAVVKYWLEKGAFGWRLDVVDELPGYFVKELRKQVKKQNPEAVIIGEVWEDASNKISYNERREYFLGAELDSVMNYPLRNMLIDFALGKIDATLFDERIMSLKENYPPVAFYSLLNILSTHDVARILTVLANAPDENSITKDFAATFKLSKDARKIGKDRLKVLVAMQMLLPGVPCIFYGDEVGVEGYGDPFCRSTYPWGKEDMDMKIWYEKMIKMRNESEIYKKGSFETVYKIGYSYGFMRKLEKEARIVLCCFNNESETVRVDLARYGFFDLTDDSGNCYHADNGIFYINMHENSVKVFSCMESAGLKD